MIKPDIVIMHCSDTPDYEKTDHNFDCFGVSDIDAWHIKRGFDRVGYHFILRQSGKVESGRVCASPTVFEPGAHCKGENLHSIGVCYIGRSKINEDQIKALKSLYLGIKDKFGIDKNSWYCHHQFNPHKTCPGFSIEFLRDLLP